MEIKLHRPLTFPYLIRFFGCIQEGNKVYILLEYAANGCLFFYIDCNDGMPEHLCVKFLYQTALALKNLHD